MAKLEKNNLLLTHEEALLLGGVKELELIPNQKGMFLLIDKEIITKTANESTTKLAQAKKESAISEEKQQVLTLIRKERLSELVEGKFENKLNEKQRKALLELVTSGEVFVFKLNETYKKGVYRVKEDKETEEKRAKKESENPLAKEKPLNEYNFAQDGFIVLKGKDSASKASFDYEKQIKEGHLRGIRSFDGNYYLIENMLVEHYINKILMTLSQKASQSIEELSQSVQSSKLLIRIICEFLKEEGEILEKKPGIYQYIK